MEWLLIEFLPIIIIYEYIYINISKEISSENFSKKQKQKTIKEYTEACNDFLNLLLNNYNENTFPKPQKKKTYHDINSIINSINHYPQLKPLIETLSKSINKNNLTSLAANLETLQIFYQKPPKTRKIKGQYVIDENKIFLFAKTKETLSHELLHASSAQIEGQIKYSGFKITYQALTLFKGLNEGYTELLNEKFFKAAKINYQTNYAICKLLEIIFDDEKELENAYFKNDITTFINKFLSYASKEELIILLKEMDYYSEVNISEEKYLELLDFICEIIGRKQEPDKILKSNQLKHTLTKTLKK